MSTLHILLAAVILNPGLFWTTLLIMLYRSRRSVLVLLRRARRLFWETVAFLAEIEARRA